MYRVQYNLGCGGSWEYRIIDGAGNIVKQGIRHPNWPDSVYAAEREAKRICAGMNEMDAVMLAAMQVKAQAVRA